MASRRGALRRIARLSERNGAQVVCTALYVLGSSVSANATTKIKTFDPSGSAGTYAHSINAGGAITGDYADTNGAIHGFVRAPDGTITAFDVRGDANGTIAEGINKGGAITGYDYETNYASRSFARASDGTVTL